MKTLILLSSILIACTSKTEHPMKKYASMDSLWTKNSSRGEVIDSLGNEYKEAHDGIIYELPSSKSVESGHFFSEAQKLVEQFIFLDEAAFLDFKKVVPCSWSESEKMESVGHTVYSIKRGRCVEKNLSYEFRPGNNRYEVRWKRESK
ncbi:MAG: hypothetical protein AB7I27_14175 [Bacteriovoracaceae bacterium]